MTRARVWVPLATILPMLLQAGLRSEMGTLLARPLLAGADYLVFSSEARTWILFIALVLFILAVPRAKAAAPAGGAASARPWFRSFLVITCLAIAVVIYANPEGRFPWNRRESYITIVGRTMKPYQYEHLSQAPDLVVMGSSVSYTVDAAQLQQRWGVPVFNMAVNGGSSDDIFHLLNFMIRRAPQGKTPSVVTIEMVRRSLHGRGGAQMPVNMIPYMDLRQGTAAALDLVDHVLRFDSLSDSIFTLAFIDTDRWSRQRTFAADGTWLQGEPVSEERYRQNLKDSIALQKTLLDCRKLDPTGIRYIEKIVALSEQYRFAIVFYFPPVSSDYYTASRIKPLRFEPCRRLLDDYMEGLAAAHPNISFKDLSSYPGISDQGRALYLDTHHLNRDGSTLLMEALSPQIEAALEWAKANR